MPSIDMQGKKKSRLNREIKALNKLIDKYHNDMDTIDSLASKAKNVLLEKQHQLDTIYDKE